MRKKYLSALLFGALLVTSAGTFTSCKDYDDEINDLQEQINKVVTDLESLKTEVDKLGGYVTDVKVEDGKLVVTVEGKEPVSYELPAGTEMEEITIDGEGNLIVGDKNLGKVTGEVTVNEDGVLMINGEEAGLKVGTEVIIKDSSNGIYTIQIGDETIKLPTAASFVTVQNIGKTIFTDLITTDEEKEKGGIYWGIVSATNENKNWKGPKGAILKDAVLFGQIEPVQISVLPVAYDLSEQELKLVDSNGKFAEATVIPFKAEELINSGSRAASTNVWNLTIEKTNAVNKDNAGYIYTTEPTKKGGKNVKYALSVNGTVVSGYDYVIDTQKESGTNIGTECTIKLNSEDYSGATELKPGSTNLVEVIGSSVYDYYIEIQEKDINDAKNEGISVDGNNKIVVASTSKATKKEITLDVVYVDVLGKKYTRSVVVKSAASATTPDELDKVTYKVATDDLATLNVDLGTVFSGLSSSEATAVKTIEWSTEDTKFLFVKGKITDVAYYDANNKVVTASDDVIYLNKIKTAKFTIANINQEAEPGSYKMTLTIKDANGNEIRKVNVPVDVTLPTFDELFAKSAAWNEAGTELTLRLDQSGEADMLTAYKTSVIASTPLNVTFDKLQINSAWVDVVADKTDGKNDQILSFVTNKTSFNIANDVIDNSKHQLRAITAKSSYNVQDIAGFKVESGKYTIKFISPLEGAKLVYFVGGKETALTVKGSSATFKAFNTDQTDPTKYEGIAIYINGKYYKLNAGEVNGLSLSTVTITDSFDSKAGNTATATVNKDGDLVLTNLAALTYETELTLTYEGTVKVTNTVNTPLAVKVNVTNK